MTDVPTPPADLGAAGLALWDETTSTFGLDAHDLVVLTEACRVKDRLDALDVVVRDEGVTVASPQGPRAHPALVESRQQEIVFTRLMASLRLPDDDDNQPQRRGRSRGAYAPGGKR